MTVYQCTNCKYKFDTRTERDPTSCPYCNKKDTLVKPKKAEDIVKEVDDIV